MSPLEAVPISSTAVLLLNCKEIRRDSVLRALLTAESLKKLWAIGIDPGAVDEIVVFSDAGTETSSQQAAILSGTFDRDGIIQKLPESKWFDEAYKDNWIYRSKESLQTLAFLKSGLLVTGTKEAVVAAVEAENKHDGDVFAAQEPFGDMMEDFRVRGSLLSMILVPPEEMLDVANASLELASSVLDLTGAGPLGRILSKIGLARGLGFSLFRQTDSYPAELKVISQDEKSASLLAGTLHILKSLGSLAATERLPSGNQQSARVFQTMSVDREKEILIIRMTFTEGDIVRAFQSPAGSAGDPRKR